MSKQCSSLEKGIFCCYRKKLNGIKFDRFPAQGCIRAKARDYSPPQVRSRTFVEEPLHDHLAGAVRSASFAYGATQVIVPPFFTHYGDELPDHCEDDEELHSSSSHTIKKLLRLANTTCLDCDDTEQYYTDTAYNVAVSVFF